MAGAMRKMGVYLGLVEGDERDEYDGYTSYADDDRGDDASEHPDHTESASGFGRGSSSEVGRNRSAGRSLAPASSGPASPVGNLALRERPYPSRGPQSEYRITTLHPRTYNEARTIGEHFRDGVPVIMNLSEMDDSDAKRLVDFAAGLSFGLRGSIERVTNKVFLISPQNVSVTAEDKARLKQNTFFNQS